MCVCMCACAPVSVWGRGERKGLTAVSKSTKHVALTLGMSGPSWKSLEETVSKGLKILV